MQKAVSTSASLTTTSQQVLVRRDGVPRRTAFSIIPLTAGVIVSINLGINVAVANKGIVITANQPLVQSNSGSFICWQGDIQAVASANGDIAIFEQFEDG